MLMSLCLGHSVEFQPFLSFQLSSGIREVFPNWNESSSEPLKVTALEQITCEEKLKQLCFSWFQDTGRLQSSLTTCRKAEPDLSLSCGLRVQQLQVVTVKF